MVAIATGVCMSLVMGNRGTINQLIYSKFDFNSCLSRRFLKSVIRHGQVELCANISVSASVSPALSASIINSVRRVGQCLGRDESADVKSHGHIRHYCDLHCQLNHLRSEP